jgi:hypothetical protein
MNFEICFLPASRSIPFFQLHVDFLFYKGIYKYIKKKGRPLCL